MQFTPESHIFPGGCKDRHRPDGSDSGYSGFFQSPQSEVDSCRSASSLIDFHDTPKENVRLTFSPKERATRLTRFLDGDCLSVQQPQALSWCETPKVHKRESSVRQRLLLGKPSTDTTKTCETGPSYTKRAESVSNARSDHCHSAPFESLNAALPLGTLKLDQDPQLSGRKRRLLFSQMRTSTLEDGTFHSCHISRVDRQDPSSDGCSGTCDQLNIASPHLNKFLPSKENSLSPISCLTNDLYDFSSVLSTPSSMHTPKYSRSVCGDSGFSFLGLDKSQDSSVDHDGSFQELLHSATKGNGATPTLSESKRRSRLQRQHRLSTLKEGGSQSEEDLLNLKGHSHEQDDVFAANVSPSHILTADKLGTGKPNFMTPLRMTATKSDTTPAKSDATCHKSTDVDLSLTPALQLVHAMCQQRAQMFVGQSPSLREQLKSTAALAETPVPFKTTMPLAGLIGRKMGVGKVDVLSELKKRNLGHVLSTIFSHLTTESIYRCSQVCKSWNEIIKQDKRASFRRRIHLSELEEALETGSSVNVADAETRLTLLKRSALKTVQSQSKSSSFCTPQSGSSTLTPITYSTLHSTSKRDKFLEVAKTLFHDESLKPCPRCRHPARCHSIKREGVCSSADCGFQFCTACLCAFHGSRECGSHSGRRHKKDILLPGSAQSKRNIRRL
ncbi:F-box only protein 43 isoform 1-T2 [Synchiropus picturatus]